MAYRTIVVGTNGSVTAYRAQHKATQVAKALGAELVIVIAAPSLDKPQSTAEAVAAKARDAASRHGVSVRSIVRSGEPAGAIVRVAMETKADLIVVGNVGTERRRKFKLGGIAEKTAHEAPCDVLIVHTREKTKKSRHQGPYRRLLVGSDGSPTATEAVRKAYDLGMMFEVGVMVTCVTGDPIVGSIVLERAASSKPDWIPIETCMVEGDPVDKMTEVAAAEGCDLIVVGNKGIVGARRYLLSSVPSRLAHRGGLDLLVAKTTERSLDDLEPGRGGVVDVHGKKLAVYLAPDGNVHAFSPRCQHLGCTVEWNDSEKTWDCPCHGSRYGFDGQVINGPTTHPLEPHRIDG